MSEVIKLAAKEKSALRELKKVSGTSQCWGGSTRLKSMLALEKAGLVKRIEWKGQIAEWRLTPAGEAWEDCVE